MGYTAIFGGTFNPFHNGHYEMLQALQNDNAIDEVWIMPDKIPPHKECDYLASDEDRINMCEIMADEFSKATVCITEFQREGKSYTYDTILELTAKYPDKNFVFVCGGDMFVYFPKWYRYEDLMKLLPFYVFSRVGTETQEFNSCVDTFERMGMKIILNSSKIANISSTAFRKEGTPSLLPQKIYDYIKERGIYNVR